jgi:hypothetical protein
MPLVRAVPLRAHEQVKVECNESRRSKTEPGAEPGMRAARYGEAEPSPHSERQSRTTSGKLFGCGSAALRLGGFLGPPQAVNKQG